MQLPESYYYKFPSEEQIDQMQKIAEDCGFYGTLDGLAQAILYAMKGDGVIGMDIENAKLAAELLINILDVK